MKTGKTNWMLTLAIATMALLAPRANALFTPELTGLSNGVAFYLTTLTNAEDAAEAKALNNALKALSKPSTSLAKDYDLFVAATLKLGPFALSDPILYSAGTNTFAFFLNAAGGEAGATAARIAALNDFVKTKKSASNNLAQAIAALNSAATNPNPQLALLQGRQVFTKLAAANKLAAVGEAHSGFAADSLAGADLTHTSRNDTGVVHLQGGGTYTEDIETGTYTYVRTGLNTGTLVLTHDGDNVTTVKLTFKSEGDGKFSAVNTSGEGTEKDSGTFTITD